MTNDKNKDAPTYLMMRVSCGDDCLDQSGFCYGRCQRDSCNPPPAAAQQQETRP